MVPVVFLLEKHLGDCQFKLSIFGFIENDCTEQEQNEDLEEGTIFGKAGRTWPEPHAALKC